MAILKDLLISLPESRVIGDENTTIDQIYYDSRKVTPGSALVCVPNDQDFETDDAKRGTAKVMAAHGVQRGATVIVATEEDVFVNLPDSVTKVLVPDTRRALAFMAAEFYGNPSRKMILVGITGTNGKTTTAQLVAEVLRGGGLKSVGVIGTLGATTENTFFDTGCTTPRSLDTQRLLAEFLANGAEAVVIEVSSHGLELQRVVACAFDAAIYTNFSQDHLDFHKTMEAYWAAKLLFFTDIAEYSLHYKKNFAAVINLDDAYGRKLIEKTINGQKYSHLTYSIEYESQIKADNVRVTPSSLRFNVISHKGDTSFNVALTGSFNVYNSLAAICYGVLAKIPMPRIQQAMDGVKSPAGRMEFISEGQDFGVVVDYAHSPASLEHVLNALREFNKGPTKLICVFGCGGERDALKRPEMGAIAATLADVVVITNDNPRGEDPTKISEDIKAGTTSGKAKIVVEHDRRKAIEYAVSIAEKSDFILLAGKGHETYQIIKGEHTHFSDQEVAREVLRSRT
ncbi:hypothetical protein TWF694_007002 [Orbilia ellipsospora]|uniref:UDP-N-acetylmuramoyl-L-alanyl-D-glutamate--2,6-diaminopimelate ligase n=1 Tax=Orbilia ellipsospora TaxID=2528407 RepID=A0AAV9XMA4_9PEZI